MSRSPTAGSLQAIDTIVEQGEGSPADREDSHCRNFLAIRGEFDELARAEPSFAPAWPVADSPVLRQPPEPEGKVYIDHPAATAALDFACATYGLLLRCLVQCFGRPLDDGALAKKALMSAAIELMHILADAATALARLPASTSASGVNTGMTFTMLAGVEPLMPRRLEKQLLVERARALVVAGDRHSTRVQDALKRACDTLQRLPGCQLVGEMRRRERTRLRAPGL